MRSNTAIAVAVVVGALVSACATGPRVRELQVTYESDPPGAVIYSGGQRFGYAPQTLRYDVTDYDFRRGYRDLDDATATWASGASQTDEIRADLRNSLSQVYVIVRPASTPGRSIDERAALDVDRTRAMQRQAAAQEEQARAQRRQATAMEEQARIQRERAAAPVTCTTSGLGMIRNTTCY